MKRFFWAMSLILTILSVNVSAQQPTKQWTFMVYLDGDNNLEGDGIDDFLEMASVGSDDNINIVVQFDRVSAAVTEKIGYEDDTRYGDWSDTNRFYITKGMEPYKENAVQQMGELNMGSQQTLTDFVSWASTNYPANNYVLVFWNHGGGWKKQLKESPAASFRALAAGKAAAVYTQFRDVCSDDTTYVETGSKDYLSTKECQEGTDAANLSAKMQLIGFDTCLAGMLEVAYQLKNSASVMVGSEQLEPGTGWPYDTVLADLAANPAMTASEFGKVIVNRYNEYYQNNNYTNVTMSAFDLSKIDALATQTSTLADTLINYWSTDKEKVKTEANGVITKVNDAVILHKHGSTWDDKAYGISINFPTNGAQANYNSDVINFASTKWPEFLNAYYNSMVSSWVFSARSNCNTFGGEPYVDLYAFANLLVNGDCDTVLVYKSEEKIFNAQALSGTEYSYLIIEYNSVLNIYGAVKTIIISKKEKYYSVITSGKAFKKKADYVVGYLSNSNVTSVLYGGKLKSTDIGLGKDNTSIISSKFTGERCLFYSSTTWLYSKISLNFDKKLTQDCNENGNCTLDEGIGVVENYLKSKGYSKY